MKNLKEENSDVEPSKMITSVHTLGTKRKSQKERRRGGMKKEGWGKKKRRDRIGMHIQFKHRMSTLEKSPFQNT